MTGTARKVSGSSGLMPKSSVFMSLMSAAAAPRPNDDANSSQPEGGTNEHPSQHTLPCPGLLVVGWLKASRLFEDIQERSRAIDSVALRIAHPFYDLRAFESFDGALRGRKRDFQFVRRAIYRDEGICPQEFDHTQRVVA